MLTDGMSLEQHVERVIELTKHDAAEQHIDFEDPANLYTVWSGLIFDRIQHCGSRQSFDAALRLASNHENLKRVYIAYAGPKAFGVLRYERGATLM